MDWRLIDRSDKAGRGRRVKGQGNKVLLRKRGAKLQRNIEINAFLMLNIRFFNKKS